MGSGSVIYIHGRGFGATHSAGWKRGLLSGLGRAGYDIGRDELEALLVSISYAAFLDPAFDPADPPDVAGTARAADPRASRALEARQAELRGRIGTGFRRAPTDAAIGKAASSEKLSQAVINQLYDDVRRYVLDEGRRRLILSRILEQIPADMDWCVLIGHSLGSIIALDLVRYWPRHIHIDLLVTMGSPAALSPMRTHLDGLVSNLPRQLLGGWLNVYDPSDTVTLGSGMRRFFGDEVVDHRVENGDRRRNHDAERHFEHITVGVAIGTHVAQYAGRSYLPFHVPEAPEQAGLMFDSALACWLRAELTQRQPKGSSRRARRVIATETLRVQASESLALGPQVDLRHHVAELSDAVQGHLDEGSLLKLQLQLRSAALFAPFALEIKRDDIYAAQLDLAKEVGWDPARIHKVDRAMREAKDSQKTQQNRTGALAMGGAAIAVAALATGGFALAAAPGVAGAAFFTSGLAGIGSLAGGGMAAGLFMTAGAGAATSLFAKTSLSMLSAVEAREEIVKIQAEAMVHRWEGRERQAATLCEELRELQRLAGREARLHHAVDENGSKSALTKDWREKEMILKRAVASLS